MNKRFLTTGILLASLLSPAWSEPVGGEVRSGSATIERAPGTTTITQSTRQAILEWQRFNISPSELVRFVQPGPAAVILNRVTGGDPSRILGKLQANGQLFLVNPNGILFGPQSRVDVGSLVATTLSLSDQDFLAGNYRFEQDPRLAAGAVVNQGTIQVSDEGYVVLTAPLVSNEGLIVANLGKVQLGAGDAFTLNLDGRGLVSYQVQSSTDAGPVVLTPDAVSQALADSVNGGALVPAGEMVLANGQLQLVGANGALVQTGTIQAGDVSLAGGRVLAGGVVQAERDIRIDSDTLSVVSGLLQSNGGVVETSGRQDIVFTGRVEAGQGGTWLVDPANLTIVSSSPGTNEFLNTDINAALNGGMNVILDAQGKPGSDPGNIVQLAGAPIAKTAGGTATLTLTAGTNAGKVTLNDQVTSTAGVLNVGITGGGAVLLDLISAPGGTVSIQGASVNELGVGDAAADIVAQSVTLTTVTGVALGLRDASIVDVSASNGSVTISHQTASDVQLTGSARQAFTYIQSGGGDLQASFVRALNGNLTLSNSGGDVALVDVKAGPSLTTGLTASTSTSGDILVGLADGNTVTLDSAGAIQELNPDAEYDLLGSNFNLTAVSGIGANNALEADSGTVTAAVTGPGDINLTTSQFLTLQSVTTMDGSIHVDLVNYAFDVEAGGNGNIYLTGVNSLEVDHLEALGNRIDLIATNGSIYEYTDDPAADLLASDLHLTAHDDIWDSLLEIEADTLTATTTLSGSDIRVKDLSGGLTATVTSNKGNIDITAVGGNLDAVAISTSGVTSRAKLNTLGSGSVRVGSVTGTTVEINSVNDIEELGSDPQADIVSSFAILVAGRKMGALAPLQVDTGLLSTSSAGPTRVTLAPGTSDIEAEARTGGDVTITSPDGDLLTYSNNHLHAVNPGGTVDFRTSESILDDNGDGLDVISGEVRLTAAKGIGTGDALELDAVQFSGHVTGVGPVNVAEIGGGGLIVNYIDTVDGLIRLSTKNGNLTLNNDVTARGAGRNVTLSTLGSGDILVKIATALDGTISLVSAGKIEEFSLAPPGVARLYSKRVALQSQSGIGTLSPFVIAADTVTNLSVLGSGNVDLRDTGGGLSVTSLGTSDGWARIEATNGGLVVTGATVGLGRTFTALNTGIGDLQVGSIVAPRGTIALNSAGAILESGVDPASDLTADDLHLVSLGGVGTAGATLETAAVRMDALVSGAGRILVRDTDDLEVTSATATDGNINVTANGLLKLGHVVAGGGKTVTGTTQGAGNIQVGDVAAGTIVLTAAGSINEVVADPAVDLTAPTLTLVAGTGIGSAGSLEIDAETLNASVSGSGGINLVDTSGASTLLRVVNAQTANGSIQIEAQGGSIRADRVSAAGGLSLKTNTTGSIQVDDIVATGSVTLDSALNVTEVGVDSGSDVVAGLSSTIRANAGLLGTSDALEVQITSGSLSVLAGNQTGGASIKLNGTVNGSSSPTGNLIHLNTPPGTSTFNGTTF